MTSFVIPVIFLENFLLILSKRLSYKQHENIINPNNVDLH